MIYAKLAITIIPSIYTIAILWLFGWQKSYSMSWYNYNERPFWKYAFSLFTFSIGYPAIMIGATPLLFFAGLMIMTVGVMSAFLDDKQVYYVHMIGAYGGILLSQISIAIDFKQYWINAVFVIGSILILIFRNYLPKTKEEELTHFFFIEALAILCIIKVLL